MSSSIESNAVQNVVIHPLVLLSVVDHFNRMKQVGNTKRVVGVLLGATRNKILDISNSFAGKGTFINKHNTTINYNNP